MCIRDRVGRHLTSNMNELGDNGLVRKSVDNHRQLHKLNNVVTRSHTAHLQGRIIVYLFYFTDKLIYNVKYNCVRWRSVAIIHVTSSVCCNVSTKDETRLCTPCKLPENCKSPRLSNSPGSHAESSATYVKIFSQPLLSFLVLWICPSQSTQQCFGQWCLTRWNNLNSGIVDPPAGINWLLCGH